MINVANIMKSKHTKLLMIYFFSIFLVQQLYSQKNDELFHPYKVNKWLSGSIIIAGLTSNYIGIPLILNKTEISPSELLTLNKDIINNMDRSSLHQDPSQRAKFEDYSNYSVPVMVLLPTLLLFDKQIRKDWVDILLIYMETMSITPNIYEWSPLGPTFQNRFRPITYYEQLSIEDRTAGNNRNSFYSGHVATVAASSFFTVKVYSDFNPELGANKYLLYGAATIPPLLLGYFRVKALKHFPSDVIVGLGVGALCGILIPELHRLDEKSISLGMFASPESTGITVIWKPDF